MWWTNLVMARNVWRWVYVLIFIWAVVAFITHTFTPLTGFLMVIAYAAAGLGQLATESRVGRARMTAVWFADHSDWAFEDRHNGLFRAIETPPFGALEVSYSNVVTGRFDGHECFDGVYEWGLLKGDGTAGRYRVAAVRLPAELPRLILIPESRGARLVKALGGADQNFESSTFNSSWRVLADDARVASDMLSPRVMSELEKLNLKSPLLFEAGWGISLDDFSKGVDTLDERLRGVLAVARLIPQHTIDDRSSLSRQDVPRDTVYYPRPLDADDQRRKPAVRGRQDGGGAAAQPVQLPPTATPGAQ
ncbi:hypothetical protein LGT39_06380 [Demequina sp. TTPB684]|uniref:hypothetical protein n=1 Tax=unclassified Demequina TaxID=2620311 RepID=UPI001CF26C9F|nr:MULTISPECIES: hypothetical protein [unclassified Demequina]MCB2412476.1 hypothetical protein [Demequina sp. TTPB684]UPU87691.1 hypothetical protein LGT36_010565 [Demequina sp. TMPB413]